MAVRRAGIPRLTCLCYNPNAQQFAAYAGNSFYLTNYFWSCLSDLIISAACFRISRR